MHAKWWIFPKYIKARVVILISQKWNEGSAMLNDLWEPHNRRILEPGFNPRHTICNTIFFVLHRTIGKALNSMAHIFVDFHLICKIWIHLTQKLVFMCFLLVSQGDHGLLIIAATDKLTCKKNNSLLFFSNHFMEWDTVSPKETDGPCPW